MDRSIRGVLDTFVIIIKHIGTTMDGYGYNHNGK